MGGGHLAATAARRRCRPTERAAPQQCIQGQRFCCVVLCSWDDWKKTQDEAAAREAAMEAAVADAEGEWWAPRSFVVPCSPVLFS